MTATPPNSTHSNTKTFRKGRASKRTSKHSTLTQNLSQVPAAPTIPASDPSTVPRQPTPPTTDAVNTSTFQLQLNSSPHSAIERNTNGNNNSNHKGTSSELTPSNQNSSNIDRSLPNLTKLWERLNELQQQQDVTHTLIQQLSELMQATLTTNCVPLAKKRTRDKIHSRAHKRVCHTKSSHRSTNSNSQDTKNSKRNRTQHLHRDRNSNDRGLDEKIEEIRKCLSERDKTISESQKALLQKTQIINSLPEQFQNNWPQLHTILLNSQLGQE